MLYTHRGFFVTTLFLGSLFIFLGHALASNQDIVINEIGAYPTGGHEWVEIWNRGADPVDIKNWKFWENKMNHGLSASSTDSIVEPGEYAVIVQNDVQFLLDYPGFLGSVFDSSWSSLSMDGEEIGLKDDNGNFVEQFTYVSTSKFSLERKDPLLNDYSPSNWIEDVIGNTVGFINSVFVGNNISPTSTASSTNQAPTSTNECRDASCNVSTSTPANTTTTESVATSSPIDWFALKINEFLPYPQTGQSEWVEIYNTASTSIDVTGATFCDNRSTGCTIKTLIGIIEGHSWATYFLSSSFLNNDGDSVILKNPSSTIIDTVSYGTGPLIPEQGQGVARTIDGNDTDSNADWSITTALTPSATNTIVAPEVVAKTSASAGGGGGGSSSQPTSYQLQATTSSTPTSTKNISASSTVDSVRLVWNITAPQRALPNQLLHFDASHSADPRGGSLSFFWNFGDGASSTNADAEHSYAATGTYAITVRATSTQATAGFKTMAVVIGEEKNSLRGDVFINEVFANPVDENTEFIEIANASSSAVDISGWQIKNSNGNYFIIPENTRIASNSLLVFYRAVTKLALDNQNETVGLLLPFGTLVDEVTILKSATGQSYARFGTAWQFTLSPTPGAVNAAVAGEKITAPKTAPKRAVKSGAPSALYSLPLAEARTAPKGTRVKIRGIVTAAPGTFSTRYFYIGDERGGIEVYNTKNAITTPLLGDEVTVVGTISIANSVPRVNIKNAWDVTVLTHSQALPVGELNADGDEDNPVGSLVTITGEVTEISGNVVYLDDGTDEKKIYLRQAAKISKNIFIKGENMQVTGILETSKSGEQILPRTTADVVDVGPSEDILKKEKVSTAQPVSHPYTSATAGGGAALVLGWIVKSRGVLAAKLLKKK